MLSVCSPSRATRVTKTLRLPAPQSHTAAKTNPNIKSVLQRLCQVNVQQKTLFIESVATNQIRATIAKWHTAANMLTHKMYDFLCYDLPFSGPQVH